MMEKMKRKRKTTDCEQEASPAVCLYLQSQKEGTEDLSDSEFSRINLMNENFGSGGSQLALLKIERQNVVSHFNIFCTISELCG